MKTTFIWVLVCTLMLAVVVPVASAAQSSGAEAFRVQLVADQRTAESYGMISYHLIYHNDQNQKIGKAWIKLKLNDELVTIEEIKGGGEWNGFEGYLKWQWTNLDEDAAGVLDLKLRVKPDVPVGKVIEVSAQAEADGTPIEVKGKPQVVVGVDVHQPIFNGYPDGLFYPERNVTRAEIAAIIARTLNLQYTDSSLRFSDTPSSHWASGYINKVAAAGYMTGHKGEFHPDETITRAEFISLLLRIRGIEAVPVKGKFSDIDDHWAKNEIATAQALKFIDGLEGGKFAPEFYIERETAAKLLAVAFLRGELRGGDISVVQHWPDVPESHWAFGWIEEMSVVAHESQNSGVLKESLKRYLPGQTESF